MNRGLIMNRTEEWKLFIEALCYGVKEMKAGKWTKLDYLKNMHKIAIVVQLPIQEILEYENQIKELERDN